MLPSYEIAAYRQTDRKIKANETDITIKDNKSVNYQLLKKTCELIHLKTHTYKNASVAEFQTLSKDKDLEIEVENIRKL